MHATRRESARILAATRRRAAQYRERAKARAYRVALEEGRAESARQCAEVVTLLGKLRSEVVDAAHHEVTLLAHQIIEELIDQRLREGPELLASWITRAVEHLKCQRGMILRYHPRYEAIFNDVAPRIPARISTSSDPSLGNRDFAIDTDVGAVTFSWRELLRPLQHGVTAKEVR
jgi:flagellar biosynthesis/type III secretory pathway protein FliH